MTENIPNDIQNVARLSYKPSPQSSQAAPPAELKSPPPNRFIQKLGKQSFINTGKGLKAITMCKLWTPPPKKVHNISQCYNSRNFLILNNLHFNKKAQQQQQQKKLLWRFHKYAHVSSCQCWNEKSNNASHVCTEYKAIPGNRSVQHWDWGRVNHTSGLLGYLKRSLPLTLSRLCMHAEDKSYYFWHLLSCKSLQESEEEEQ